MPLRFVHRLIRTHGATLLLLLFIVLPIFLLGGAGLSLLRHEQERLEREARSAQQALAVQIAGDLRAGMEALYEEVEALLNGLEPDRESEGVEDLMHAHPLIRFGFVVAAGGEPLFPPRFDNMDTTTREFFLRYESLFNGSVRWFDPEKDAGASLPALARSEKYQALKDFRSRSFERRSAPAAPMAASELPRHQIHWKAWHWQEGATLLSYYRTPGSGNIVGVELEMIAVYSRLQPLVGGIAGRNGEAVAALRDLQGRDLVVSQEPPDLPPSASERIGPLLPFAELVLFGGDHSGSFDGRVYFLVSSALALALLASILVASLVLGALLRRSRREAEQRVNFVSHVSHEFKTPLTTIRLYTDLLLEGRVSSEEKRERYLRTMQSESLRLARLVQNVLSFSRIEQGRSKLHVEVIDATEELLRILNGQEERLDAAGIRMELPDSPSPHPVSFDRDAFEQIALNLTDNAIKYASEGGLLRLELRTLPGQCEIRFVDRGPGVPRRLRKRIFRPFQQVDERLTRRERGAGLGLSISAQLATDLGGSLKVAETSGGGATFIWTLPGPPSAHE